jgi:hypothetical protein
VSRDLSLVTGVLNHGSRSFILLRQVLVLPLYLCLLIRLLAR